MLNAAVKTRTGGGVLVNLHITLLITDFFAFSLSFVILSTLQLEYTSTFITQLHIAEQGRSKPQNVTLPPRKGRMHLTYLPRF